MNELSQRMAEQQQAARTAELAHQSAVTATVAAARKVRRSGTDEEINDLLDAVEDERAAAKEYQSAVVSSIMTPIIAAIVKGGGQR